MINKVYKLFIGKDIDRVLADADTFDTVSETIANGEVTILNKDLAVLTAADEYAESEVIYIAEGTGRTLSYANEAGTAVTGRHILLSDAINGKKIKNVSYRPYSAKTECVATIPAITGTITAGVEYVLKLVFSDIEEHPGQFTQTYRYIAVSGDTSQTIFNGLRARIAKHKGARVTASGTTTLVLTGKSIPEATSSVASIDEFKMVDFKVLFNFVDNTYSWSTVPAATDITVVPAHSGSGNWEQIRDMEKFELGYRGVSNRTHFPVASPDFRTVNGETYDVLTIEYDTDYRSPDNSYEKSVTKEVKIAIAVPADDTNADLVYFDVYSKLATWLASVTTSFTAPEVQS